MSTADAMNYVSRLLSHKAYTEKEIRERLSQRGFSNDCIQELVHRLIDLKFIDDTAWLEGFVRCKKRKGWGPKRIFSVLRTKGFTDTQISPFLQDNDQQTAIEALLSTRYRGKDLGNASDRAKVARALLRRGFHSDIVFSVLNQNLYRNKTKT